MNIVITTIQPPTHCMKLLAAQLEQVGGTLWVVGDRKGPETYPLPNTQFLHIEDQKKLDFALARLLPEGHYTRKNLGYLCAIKNGAKLIVETDDDNAPLPAFFNAAGEVVEGRTVRNRGPWVNVYKAFTTEQIWPRGLPLEFLHFADPELESKGRGICYIQQGLADDNPDVDAVFRLTMKLPFYFQPGEPVIIPPGIWCPFNSQNTTFFHEAFPLLYLPSNCSFRMTDIWRSFVAQRCLWEMDSSISFHAASVRQERNEHSLLRDFEQEIPGYLKNEEIRIILQELKLRRGKNSAVVSANLVACYEALVAASVMSGEELPLVEAWTEDIRQLHSRVESSDSP